MNKRLVRLIYGFTATQQPSREGAALIRDTLVRLPEPDLVVTGGCIGGDSIIGQWYAEFTEAKQHVILPSKLKKVSLWFHDYPHVTFEQMPAGTDYMDRNTKLVEYCVSEAGLHSGLTPHRLSEKLKAFAFPKEQREVIRSGTWATVRRFRRAGIEPKIFPLP